MLFNAGVEVGRLLFIAAALGLWALASRTPVPRPAWAWRLPAYGSGTVAAFSIERVVGFWG